METIIKSNLLNEIKHNYEYALNQTDPRVRDYPLVWNDPTYVLYLVSAYLLMVTCGKKIMSHLPEVHVPASILFTYNFSLVLLSIYMFVEILIGIIQADYNLACAKINNSKGEMRVVNALWWYFFSKAIEFLDTFWMIVRKRFNQVTFLHVFHHSTMLIIWWIVISWIPAGQAYFGAALNSLVHIFMYSYYALSVIPSLKDKLWWKKYITTIQLVQFVITFSHTVQGIIRSCEFPKWGQILLAVYMVIMLVLFSNFYIQEYVKKANEAKRRKQMKKDMNNNELDIKTNDKHKKENKNGKVKKED